MFEDLYTENIVTCSNDTLYTYRHILPLKSEKRVSPVNTQYNFSLKGVYLFIPDVKGKSLAANFLS